MNAVDAFSAQVGNYLSPAWSTGPVQAPASLAVQTTAPASGGYWYSLPQGNPQSLTVAQVVAQAYGLDPSRDSSQIQQMASYVAQQNNLFLANFPIPSSVTGLRLPYAPTAQNGGQPAKKKSSFNLGSLLAGLAAAAAGVGQIVMRHDGRLGGSTPFGGLSTGMPGPTPGAQPTQAQMIAADIGDGIPALADLAAGIAGDPIPQAYPQPYTQPYPQSYPQSYPQAYPQQPSPMPQQPTAPYIPQQVGVSYPAQPYPAQPYPATPYPTSAYSAQEANSWGSIANDVSSLAQSVGQLFGHHRH